MGCSTSSGNSLWASPGGRMTRSQVLLSHPTSTSTEVYSCLYNTHTHTHTHTEFTLQMWSLREPFSLNGRMSRAEDSPVLENSSGQRYGVWRGGRGLFYSPSQLELHVHLFHQVPVCLMLIFLSKSIQFDQKRDLNI